MKLYLKRNGAMVNQNDINAEAERLLADAQHQVIRQIIRQLKGLNTAIARHRYRKALEQSRALTSTLLELELYQ